MKHQQISVDYWAMGKTMLTYGVLTILCWIMLRLFNMVFMLPRRLRSQQDNMQKSLQDLQRRFPDLNITEEDLLNAEKDLEELMKENDSSDKDIKEKVEESDSVEDTRDQEHIDTITKTSEDSCTKENKKTI